MLPEEHALAISSYHLSKFFFFFKYYLCIYFHRDFFFYSSYCTILQELQQEKIQYHGQGFNLLFIRPQLNEVPVTKQGVWFWLSPLGPLVCTVLGLSMQSTLREELVFGS